MIDLFLLSNDEKESIERIIAIKKINDLPNEKVSLLNQKIKDNKNLKNQKVLDLFNELMVQYNFDKITFKDFDKLQVEEIDDLPF
ncbi:MAG: hypothetical protein ACOVQC_07060 [Flavobacterium sp.]